MEFENKIDARDAVHNAQSNLVLDGHRMYAFVLSDISAGITSNGMALSTDFSVCIARKHGTLNQWWFNVWPMV